MAALVEPGHQPADRRFADTEFAAARMPLQAHCLPNGPRGRALSKSLRGRRGCNCRKAACRKCGKMPLRQYLDAWRSSYEPPVRGHRHYRQILTYRILIQRIKDRWTQRSARQNEMVLSLAVVAILLLLGLLCCVVLVLFLGRRGRGGSDVALEFAHPRFHLIDQPDILVIPHY